jgi:GT2 family glycosyltransferase
VIATSEILIRRELKKDIKSTLTIQAQEHTLGLLHNYFDGAFYSKTYMGGEVDAVTAVLHYINIGVPNYHKPSPLVDPVFMKQARRDLFADNSNLRELIYALENNLCDPSPYFSLYYYKSQVTGRPIDGSVLRHFLSTANAEFKRPMPYFDLNHYRTHLPQRSSNLDDFYDFVLRGDKAGFSASRHFDPSMYIAECTSDELNDMGPLEHYLRYGRFEGRKIYPLRKSGTAGQVQRCPTAEWSVEIDAQSWKDSYEQMSRTLATEARRSLVEFVERSLLRELPWCTQDFSKLHFQACQNPVIDVIIPAYNEFRHTVNALLSVMSSQIDEPYRVLLVDDASPDPELRKFSEVPGLVYIRNSENLHFLRSCNAAWKKCTAKYVVLLNNDALLYPDTLQKLFDSIENDSSIGCVGPKILYPNGRLQEAGCYIYPDGGTLMIGVGDDPSRAHYNYDRDVDYVSGACIMFRRDAVDGDLFDEQFRPAYCEDSDLALRITDRGLRVRYVASARAIHHLSVSTAKESEVKRVQLSSRNQARLAQKWATFLGKKSRVRVLSFYLPQFHPIAENDLWWGTGFTEWTNVARAVSSYPGHYQPHLPADLGYYDLRMPEVLAQQQRLARRYGVEGFAVYYYNFGGQKILWEPVGNLLASKSVDFCFCLCWANENWSKHWDGGEREILLAQSYEIDTLEAVCQDFVLCAADPRAIKVNDKPLVLVYRPLLFPNILAFTTLLRRRFAEAGFPGVHLCYVESMEAIAQGIKPASIGFDAAIEFPPQGVGAPAKINFGETKDGWEGKVYDYEASVVLACNRSPTDYPRYPGVFPSWDNTPRQPLKATSFYNSSPELFQAYVESKVDYLNKFFTGDERLLFVNAWNEWAEGTHLEPDKAYGHAWLEALRNATEQY